MPRPLFLLGVILWWALAKRSCVPHFTALSSSITENKQIPSKKFGNRTGKPQVFFGQTEFTTWFTFTMFRIQYTTAVELCVQEMGDFCEKSYSRPYTGLGYDPQMGHISSEPPKGIFLPDFASFDILLVIIGRAVWSVGAFKKKININKKVVIFNAFTQKPPGPLADLHQIWRVGWPHWRNQLWLILSWSV